MDGDPHFRIGLPADVMLLKNIAARREIIPSKTVFASGGREAVCTLQTSSPLANNQPTEWKPVITPIRIAGRTEDAVALDNSLPPNTWVLSNPMACGPRSEAKVLLEPLLFDPTPSFSNASLAKLKQGQAITNLPPPKPKGWLQSILGL